MAFTASNHKTNEEKKRSVEWVTFVDNNLVIIVVYFMYCTDLIVYLISNGAHSVLVFVTISITIFEFVFVCEFVCASARDESKERAKTY